MEVIKPGQFLASKCFVEAGWDKEVDPMVKMFLELQTKEILDIYCGRNPEADPDTLHQLLTRRTRYFRWGGVDIMPFHEANGRRGMTVIESNCCPGGSLFTATGNWADPHWRIIWHSLIPHIGHPSKGVLAVFYNLPKHTPDMYGYASALADITQEPVYLVNIEDPTISSVLHWTGNGQCLLQIQPGDWTPVRAAFKRLGLQPWTKMPLLTKMQLVNPMLGCICGGHDKLIIAKAFAGFNKKYRDKNIQVDTPRTFFGVTKAELPSLADQFNYLIAIKLPNSTAMITSRDDLSRFLMTQRHHPHTKFIVQTLICHPTWMDDNSQDHKFHRPGKMQGFDGKYVFDLRFIVACGQKGWRPCHLVCRRAEMPLEETLPESGMNNFVLKTNVTRRLGGGSHVLKESCGIVLSRDNFEPLDLTMADLVDGFIQTILAANAIEDVCEELMLNGRFDLARFHQISEDGQFLEELAKSTPGVWRFLDSGFQKKFGMLSV